MRILMHIDSLGPGGSQRQIAELGMGLARRGHEVQFNCYFPLDHFRPQLEKAGIAVRMQKKAGRYSIAPVIDLVRHARRMRAQAIIAFLPTPTVHAEAAKIVLRNCKVIASHRSAFPEGRLSFGFWARQQLHRAADALTANSTREGRAIAARFPWLGRKTEVILNGHLLGEAAAGDGKLGSDLQLLALASVYWLKDPLSLAKALRICRQEQGLRVHVAWAGEPLMRDGRCEELEAVDSYLADHDLTNHWTWLGLCSDTRKLLARCDALIHTSLTEGFSNAVAEAMVAGRPVLVGIAGDQQRVIDDSGAGLLFETANPQSIADAIARFYALSDQERAEMGRAARHYAETHLSLDNMIDRYEGLLRRLVPTE